MNPEVSVIIPSYNSFRTIGQTLKSLIQQTTFDSIREIVVVDSSDDIKTRETLRNFYHHKVKTVLLREKTIPARGRNIGSEYSQGKLLCFIDSDVCLAKNWLEEILTAYTGGCKVGGGSISVPDFQKGSPLALAQLYLQFNEYLDAGARRRISIVPGCNMFCESEVFQKAGGFPEVRASEDSMLCLKIGETTPVWFVPCARSYHIFRQIYRSYYQNQHLLGKYIIIYRQHLYHCWYYEGLFPLFFLPGFLVVKFFRISTRLIKAGPRHLSKFLFSLPIFLLGLSFWSVGFAKGCRESRSYDE